MVCRFLCVYAMLMLAFDASAQTLGVSRFRNVWESFNDVCGSIATRPAPSNYPSCTWNYTEESVGSARAIWYTAEGAIASTSVKDPLIDAYSIATHGWSAGGSNLVFKRHDTTSGPPATGTNCASGPPCFNYDQGLASVNTCAWPSAGTGVRALANGATIALNKARTAAAVSTYRPNGQRPIEMLVPRFDLVIWTEMQVDGFDNAWLAGNAHTWSDWTTWIGGSSSADWSWSADCRGIYTSYCGHDVGIRYNDQIEARGGDPEDYVYYLTRPDVDTSSPLSPNGVLVRTDNDDYQDWRLDQIELLIAETGIKMVYLAHKQLFHKAPGMLDKANSDVDGSFACEDVYDDFNDMVTANPSSGCFTGNTYSAGWTWGKYTEGNREYAQKLIARGIPYAVSSNGGEFVTSSPLYLDDPSTTPSAPGAGQTAATGTYEVDGNDRNCSTPNGSDFPVGTSCEMDDWRFITRNASFIWYEQNCAGCAAAFDPLLAAWGIPYVKTTSVTTRGDCPNAVSGP